MEPESNELYFSNYAFCLAKSREKHIVLIFSDDILLSCLKNKTIPLLLPYLKHFCNLHYVSVSKS